MTKVLKVRDEKGLGIDYAQFEEVIHPVQVDIPRRLKAVKEFKYEKGDVIVCTYPKSVAFGSFLDYATSWSKVITEKIHTDIILVYYEDLVQNCLRELKRIQEFLGIDRDDETLRLIAQRCSFNSLQNTITAGKMPVVVRNSAGDSILLRKGKVGDWRNHFTAEQSETFDKACQARLQHTIFNFRDDTDTPKHRL